MGPSLCYGLILVLGCGVLVKASDNASETATDAGSDALLEEEAMEKGLDFNDSQKCPPAMKKFEKEKYEGKWYLTHMSRSISLEAECYEADSHFYNKAESVNITVRLLPKGMSKDHISEHDFMDLMVEWKGKVGFFTTKEKVTGQREGPLKIIGTDYDSFSVTRYCHHNRAYEGYLVYGREKVLPEPALKKAQDLLTGFNPDEKLYPIPRCST